TGIGLSLVKDLVTLHGGSIQAQSQEGFGSEFTVSFPAGKEHLPATAIIEDSAAADVVDFADRSRLELAELELEEPSTNSFALAAQKTTDTILVVEDNHDVREYIRSILKDFRVLEAKDGEEGLSKTREHKPSLVISDVMMPGMSGY